MLALYGPAGDSGRVFAERLRKGIRALKISHDKSSTDQFLSASIGVAVITPDSECSLAGAVQMADEALYQAKEEGRNRVVVKGSGNAQLRTGEFHVAGRAPA